MGALSRITRVQVFIIAGVLLLIACLGIWFGLIKPQQEALDAAKARYDAAEPDSTPDKKLAAQKDLIKAQGEVKVAEAKWDVYNHTLMPVIDISNFIRGSQQLWNEQVLVLGPMVEHFLREDTSVQVTQANITLPAPSTDPNQVNRKVFEFPLGTITVQGTFKNILAHVERWNKFKRLVVADGLSLSGVSPRLTGTYTLTAYIFTQGDASKAIQVPQATNANGGFGGGFGGPGGMPEGEPGAGDYPTRGQGSGPAPPEGGQ